MYRTYLNQCARVFSRSLINIKSVNYLHSGESYVGRCQRLQLLKSEDELCKQSMAEADFVVFAQRKPLLKHKDGQYSVLFNKYNDVRPYFTDDEHLISRSILLNVGDDSRSQFAVALPDAPESLAADLEKKSGGKLLLQRAAYFILPPQQSDIISQGAGMLAWDRHLRFCPHCGHGLIRYVSGSQKKCSSCKRLQYPQTSPVVITLVSNETNTACVLVHQSVHYKNMYTAIAGFLEIGESVEDAVRREIAEEVGIEIKSQRYLSSQYWTGPSNALMIGCLAVATEAELTIDKKELEDGRWFTVDEVKQGLKNIDDFEDFNAFVGNKENKLIFPPRPAIAQILIREWLNQRRPSF